MLENNDNMNLPHTKCTASKNENKSKFIASLFFVEISSS